MNLKKLNNYKNKMRIKSIQNKFLKQKIKQIMNFNKFKKNKMKK